MHPQGDRPARRELEGVRQQVLEDLLQPLRVGVDVRGQIDVHVGLERQVLLLGERPERPIDEVGEIGQRHLARLDRHLARFDLRQIEDLVDQREQIPA